MKVKRINRDNYVLLLCNIHILYIIFRFFNTGKSFFMASCIIFLLETRICPPVCCLAHSMFCVMNEITWVTNHDFCLPVLWRQRASSEAAIFSRCCHTSGHYSSISIVQVRITWSSAHLIRYLPSKGDINCDVNRMFVWLGESRVFFVVCNSNERHSSVVGCGWTHAHLRRHRKIRLGQGQVYLFLFLTCCPVCKSQ